MTRIKDVIRFLESIAPLELQESYDNAGLIAGDPDQEISGVVVCLDSTEDVVQEAIDKGCNLIIAHHPIIFKGIKKITPEHYIARTIMKAIRQDIAIYAIHTNLDNVLVNGVNDKIGQRLDLKEMEILAPKNPEATIGSGLIGYLEEPMKEDHFLDYLKTAMQTSCIRHTQLLGKQISSVALCGGSGRFLLEEAIRLKADVFISADFKYHDFFEANDQILIADIGHFESEQFTINLIVELLNNNFSNFAARFTETSTNPIKYFF